MLYPAFPGIDFDIQIILMIFAAFFVGGLCKGAIGFGLPIVVISLLSMFVPVSFGIALNVIPPFILNIWQQPTQVISSCVRDVRKLQPLRKQQLR